MSLPQIISDKTQYRLNPLNAILGLARCSLQSKRKMEILKKASRIFFLLISINCTAQSRYNIIYEEQLGMNFASENLVSIYHAYDFLDSIIVPKEIFLNDDRISKFGKSFYRLNKLFWFNYLVNDYTHTMNHERFGHGYRAIDNGAEIIRIVYGAPPPFGAEYSFIEWDNPTSITLQQNILNTIRGSEVGLVTSDIIRKNILLDERLTYNFALPYLYTSNDLPGYTAFSPGGGDPPMYVGYLNTYNFLANYPMVSHYISYITLKKLQKYSYIALFLDPLNFYALKSAFYDYLILGKHSTKIGMIQLSDRIKYLPRFRMEYTPYGPELVIQNYFKLDKKLFQLSYSFSDGTFEPSRRVLANIWNIKAGKDFSFNLSGQIWEQPSIDYYIGDNLSRSKGLGGQVVTVTNYDFISDNQTLGLTMHIGYKTKGFSLGEQIDQGVIIRGGLTFRLGN